MLHYEGLHGVGKLLIREELVLIRPVYHRILFAIVLLSFTVVPRVNAQEPKPVAPQIELTPTANGVKIARANESFSTLSLKGSDLLAEAPLFGSREVTPQFVRELLQVKWRPNDPLDLYVILPVSLQLSQRHSPVQRQPVLRACDAKRDCRRGFCIRAYWTSLRTPPDEGMVHQ